MEPEIYPGRSLHKILDLVADGPASYPVILHTVLGQAPSKTKRKKLSRKLSILADLGLLQIAPNRFTITPAGETRLAELGRYRPAGAPTVRIFATQPGAA